jgi:FMN phosphatase YigB (HAD superfamily)
MFLYFDLGNVVVRFDHLKGCRQMAAVAGLSPDQVFTSVFDSGLNRRCELGEVSNGAFYEQFCGATGTKPELNAFLHAASDIFTLNDPLIPVLGALEVAGYRMGILSNTCDFQWQRLMSSEYGILPAPFSVFALSFQIGAIKPDPKIYHAAAEMAGVAPKEIFFCDDVLGHVTAARDAGFDAVHYMTTASLVADLRRRGVRFNY